MAAKAEEILANLWKVGLTSYGIGLLVMALVLLLWHWSLWFSEGQAGWSAGGGRPWPACGRWDAPRVHEGVPCCGCQWGWMVAVQRRSWPACGRRVDQLWRWSSLAVVVRRAGWMRQPGKLLVGLQRRGALASLWTVGRGLGRQLAGCWLLAAGEAGSGAAEVWAGRPSCACCRRQPRATGRSPTAGEREGHREHPGQRHHRRAGGGCWRWMAAVRAGGGLGVGRRRRGPGAGPRSQRPTRQLNMLAHACLLPWGRRAGAGAGRGAARGAGARAEEGGQGVPAGAAGVGRACCSPCRRRWGQLPQDAGVCRAECSRGCVEEEQPRPAHPACNSTSLRPGTVLAICPNPRDRCPCAPRSCAARWPASPRPSVGAPRPTGTRRRSRRSRRSRAGPATRRRTRAPMRRAAPRRAMLPPAHALGRPRGLPAIRRRRRAPRRTTLGRRRRPLELTRPMLPLHHRLRGSRASPDPRRWAGGRVGGTWGGERPGSPAFLPSVTDPGGPSSVCTRGHASHPACRFPVLPGWPTAVPRWRRSTPSPSAGLLLPSC